jgi:hypothetical protein
MYPDGFCSINCNEHKDCPGDAVCADVEQGVCLIPCVEAVDCEFLGPGWTCATRPGRPIGEVMVCVGL